MRAGVLSDDRVINFLNENFINTWVLNSELGRKPRLRDPIAKRREREGKTFDTSHALVQAVIMGWNDRSPVDCLVISPKFELMGSLSVKETYVSNRAAYYLTFLKRSLAGERSGVDEDTLEPKSTD